MTHAPLRGLRCLPADNVGISSGVLRSFFHTVDLHRFAVRQCFESAPLGGRCHPRDRRTGPRICGGTRGGRRRHASPELRLIYDTAPIGLAFLTPDCRYALINQHLTEICGISVADHIGRSVRDCVPKVADQVEQLVQAIVQSGQPVTGIEINGQRPDGSNTDRIWITYWHPMKNQSGVVLGVNVAAEEITERKRAEQALAASRESLRQLNDTLAERVEAQAKERDRIWNVSQDLLAVMDLEGVILDVNPAWSSKLGWSSGRIGRQQVREVCVVRRSRPFPRGISPIAGRWRAATLRKSPIVQRRKFSLAGVARGLGPRTGLCRRQRRHQDQTDPGRTPSASAHAGARVARQHHGHHDRVTWSRTQTAAHGGRRPAQGPALRWLNRPEPDLAEAQRCFAGHRQGKSAYR